MRQIAVLFMIAAGFLLAACEPGALERFDSRNLDYQAVDPAYRSRSTSPVGPGYGAASPLAPEGCATPLHQNRPGGSDYRGPPVPGCTGP